MKSWMPFTRASNEKLFNMPVISLHEETKGVRHSVGSIFSTFSGDGLGCVSKVVRGP
jgi:hypothetical protein